MPSVDQRAQSDKQPGHERYSCFRILPPGVAGRGRKAQLNHDIFDAMTRKLSEPTAKCATKTFGVGERTWAKLRNGEPVRASVVERLVERLKVEEYDL